MVWDVSGTDRDLLAGTARNFAASSCELVFHQAIPAKFCKLLEVRTRLVLVFVCGY